MGALRWTPETFWSATVYDYRKAISGFKKVKGINEKSKVWTRDDAEHLRDVAREERARDLRRNNGNNA